MGTQGTDEGIASALFGKTRRILLGILYANPGDAYYLRRLAREAGTGVGAVQRELKRLSEAGVVRREVRDRQVYFRANPDCPVYADLRSFIVKTAGVGDVLRAALAPLAPKLRAAFVYGSVARGEEKRGSDVDLMLVGDITFAEVVRALRPAQTRLAREINPSVYSLREFTSKLAAGHHFLKSVMKSERLFLVGSDRELA